MKATPACRSGLAVPGRSRRALRSLGAAVGLAFAIAALGFAAGCDLTLFASRDGDEGGGASTNAEFFLPGDANASIESFVISGSGPNGESVGPVIVEKADLADWRTDNLALGEWAFHVEAWSLPSAGGVLVGDGDSSYEVSRDDYVIPVDLGFPPGSGFIDVALSWTPTDISGAVSVELELVEGPGAPPALTPIVNAALGTATLASTGLDAGQYLLSIRILSDGRIVWGKTDSMLVYDAATTSAVVVVPNGDINDRPAVTPQLAAGAVLNDPSMVTALLGYRAGMNVRYTVDGADPDAGSGTSYTDASAPIAVSGAPTRTLRVYAESDWGVQPLGTYAYVQTNALHASSSGSDASPGQAAAPKASVQSAVDRAVLLANMSGTQVEVKVAGGAYTDADGLILNGNVYLRGGYDALFGASDPELNVTVLSGESPASGTAASPNAALVKPAAYSGDATVEGFTIQNNASATDKYTAGVLAAGAGTLSIIDCEISGGAGSFRSSGVAAIGSSPIISDSEIDAGTSANKAYGIYVGGASSPTLLRSRVWAASGSVAPQAENRGVIVEGGSGSISIVSSAIMALGPDSAGIELYSAASGDSLTPRLYGNTVLGEISALLIDDKWGRIVRDQVNAIYTSADASPVDIPKLNETPSRSVSIANYGAFGAGGAADVLANNPSAIASGADFFAFDWNLAPLGDPEADALAAGGFDLGAGLVLDLVGASRTVPWSIGAMERE